MKIPDIELMLYSDGELEDERARRVRVARLHHPEVGTRLEGIERVGAFVRVWAAAEGVDTGALRRRTLRGAARRRTFGALAVALVAVAAVAEPVATPRALEVALATPRSPQGGTPSPAVSPFGEFAASAIESVDFGSHAGTVFVVETGDSVTPVVWLDDDARAGG